MFQKPELIEERLSGLTKDEIIRFLASKTYEIEA